MIYTTLWKLFLPGKVCLYHIQWLSNDNKLVFDSLNSCYCINFLTVECQRQASLSNFANLRVHAQLRARFAQWRAAVQLQQEARNLQWISQVYLFKWFLCHLTILSFTAPTLVDLLYTTHILLSSDKFYLFVYTCSFIAWRFSENVSANGESTVASRKLYLLCVQRHCSQHCGSSGLLQC